jgi:hypothetical protein
MEAVSRMELAGVPLDTDSLKYVKANWEGVGKASSVG